MLHRICTLCMAMALVCSSIGIAASAFAWPVSYNGKAQMMHCANGCPGCVSHGDKKAAGKNNCCGDELSRCGMSSSSAPIFYVPASVQSIAVTAANLAFAFDNEQVKPASFTPDKQPPKHLS